MSKLGRNDLCTCGSGLKYKRCCLKEQPALTSFPWNDPNVDAEWMKIRRTEGELVPELIAFARDRYGEHALEEAWDEFTLWAKAPIDGPELDDGFIPWFIFNWVPDNAERDPGDPRMPEAPVALTYLNEKSFSLDPFQKRFIESICAEPYTFFVILGANPGKTLVLRDVLLKREIEVKERQASLQLKRGDLIFGRALTLDDQAIMVGMMPLMIPSRYHLHLIDFRNSLAKTAKKLKLPMNRQLLNEYDLELREFYFDIAEELKNPQMPVLVNTDGDPLTYIEIHYRLNCPPQEALNRLDTLVIKEFRKHILEDATYDSTGKLKAVTLDWHKRGNKQHLGWTNTVLGHVSIDGKKLTVDVNSEKRSTIIQMEIKRRLGDSATLLKTKVQPIDKKSPSLSGGRGAQPSENSLKRKTSFNPGQRSKRCSGSR